MRIPILARALLFVASLTVAGRAAAAETPLPSPLTAAGVTAYAEAHREELRAANAKAAAATATPKVVASLPDPMLMVSADHVPFTMIGEKGVDWSVMVQQDFPLSGVLGARRRAATALAASTSSDVGRVLLDVQTQALLAFAMRVEVERMQRVLDDQIVVARQVVATIEARLAGGGASAADVLRARTESIQLEGERRALDAELAGADAMLDASLGRPVTEPVPSPSLTTPSVPPSPLAVLVAQALEKRPELSTMRAASASASANVAVMQGMYWPMAFVRAGTARTMEMGQGAMLMLGISIPLFWERRSGGLEEARAMLVMVDAETAAMRNMIQGEVGGARGELVAAEARWATARDEVVPLADKTVSLTLASYVGDQVPLVSVLDAVRTLREAKMRAVVAELAVARAWIKLSRAVGVAGIGPL